MKSVLIRINPKWCAMIASGEKTVEVRKNRPKLEIPFKCYIYCTKHNNDKLSHWSGKVIGEFMCYGIDHFDSAFDEWARSVAPGGSIIDSMGWDKFLEIMEKEARITMAELEKYFPEDVKAYLWHISGLKIYDTPKELREFYRWAGWEELRPCENHKKCDFYSYDPLENVEYCTIDYDGSDCPYIRVSKPPQSWMYIDD